MRRDFRDECDLMMISAMFAGCEKKSAEQKRTGRAEERVLDD
jgi:hypothetical protein